ncbi:hypothetical protein [uncultured Mycobacterium sp.]|uniref:hypothetical protein n=1 Tax=uncultured Mycobacterium sp. TaxID=171292 RepID=UPI0035CC177F
MRFDDYVRGRSVALTPVDRFAGFEVNVWLPAGWERVGTVTGMQVWCPRDGRSTGVFCANAVLTMHHVAAALDAAEVFAMLVDEQLHSVPGCREKHRAIAPAQDGVGVEGFLALHIPTHEFGALDSVTHSRIITDGQQTLIAQLTLTALHSAPVQHAVVRLAVQPGASPAGVHIMMGDAYPDEPTPAAEPGESVQRPLPTPQRVDDR